MNIAMLIMASLLAYGPWESIGPEGGEVRAILQSSQDPDDLFALSGSYPAQLIRSQDGGSTWEPVSEIPNCYPYDMAMTSSGTLVVFGSSRTWRSTDGGNTWDDTYIANHLFWNGEPHPTDGNIVYATGYRYSGTSWNMAFYSSVDGGASWSSTDILVTASSSYGRVIAVSASNPAHIMVGGYEYNSGYTPYLFKSEDGGASFTDITPAGSNYYYNGAAFHPTDCSIMLAGDLYSVFRSTDGGTSWTKTGSLTYNYDITFSDADHNLVLSSGTSRTYRSTNGGQSWTSITAGLDGSSINWIEPDASSSSTAYTGSTTGFFRSTDGGQSWTGENSGLSLGKALAMEYVNGWLFMNIQDMGLWKVQDGHEDWQVVDTPLSCGDFCALEAVGPDTLLALEGAG